MPIIAAQEAPALAPLVPPPGGPGPSPLHVNVDDIDVDINILKVDHFTTWGQWMIRLGQLGWLG